MYVLLEEELYIVKNFKIVGPLLTRAFSPHGNVWSGFHPKTDPEHPKPYPDFDRGQTSSYPLFRR